ncbi:hypothetical protein SAMN05880501_105170 [Ureibacillus xyleni]|uniref:Uncharacterized protein n=1 Tax=Ureibacillus xyleni TaxID=614648 RepID=A0A285SM68_9BACL|nr:hypothetical protein [Ureibacillus xyleni]SOC09034.1 hypothetical protein SAMN05880501_105170 [Ureibacillus xyleni]
MTLKHTTTMLIGEINEEIFGLDTFLGTKVGEFDKSVAEHIIKEIEEKYIVTSWKEFLEKFSPSLYEMPTVNEETEKFTINYTTKKPYDDATAIEFSHSTPFIQSIIRLMDQREANGETNAYFEFSEALKSFSPERVKEQAQSLKKEMLSLTNEYQKLDDRNPEKQRIGANLRTKLNDASKLFNNKTALLQLAQATIGEQLLQLAAPAGSKNADKTPLALTTFEITEQGIQTSKLHIEHRNSDNDSSNNVEGAQALIGFIGNSYDYTVSKRIQTAEVDKRNESYQKDLVVTAFTATGSQLINPEEIPQKIQQYNHYVEATANVMESYFKAISKIFSTIVGVKLFFDEYERHTKLKKVKPRLLVTNAKLENLLAKDQFKKFINTVNDINFLYVHGLTSVIVPGVDLKEKSEEPMGGFDPLTGQMFEAPVETKSEGVSLQDVQVLAKYLAPYKIPLFFGFNSESSTFASLQQNAFDQDLRPILEKLKSSREEHDVLVPCYPNMTVIPKNSNLTTATKVQLTDEKSIVEDGKTDIYLPGFYIDSSYIAASLVAAHHCSGYLKGKYPDEANRITDDYPGIRLAYPELVTKTLLPIEVKGLPSSLIEEATDLGVGFMFISENRPASEKRITVRIANTCKVMDNGRVRPLYRVLVERFVYNEVIDNVKGNSKEAYERQLDAQVRGSLKANWELLSRNNQFNRLFKEKETVGFETLGNSGFIKVSFNNEETPLTVDISSEEVKSI